MWEYQKPAWLEYKKTKGHAQNREYALEDAIYLIQGQHKDKSTWMPSSNIDRKKKKYCFSKFHWWYARGTLRLHNQILQNWIKLRSTKSKWIGSKASWYWLFQKCWDC